MGTTLNRIEEHSTQKCYLVFEKTNRGEQEKKKGKEKQKGKTGKKAPTFRTLIKSFFDHRMGACHDCYRSEQLYATDKLVN